MRDSLSNAENHVESAGQCITSLVFILFTNQTDKTKKPESGPTFHGQQIITIDMP